jgi:hypothetical protein
MTSTYQLFENLSPRAAADLTRYFDEIDDDLFNLDDRKLNLLPPLVAAELTAKFHSFHPVVRELGGIIIDDPGAGDHHVFLSRPPLEGAVLFLAHDDDTRVVFSSLREFLSAATAAKQQHKFLTDFHPLLSPAIADQVGLGAFMRQALVNGSVNDVVVALIPCLDLHDLDLLEQLVGNKDFFLVKRSRGRSASDRPPNSPLSQVSACDIRIRKLSMPVAWHPRRRRSSDSLATRRQPAQ